MGKFSRIREIAEPVKASEVTPASLKLDERSFMTLCRRAVFNKQDNLAKRFGKLAQKAKSEPTQLMARATEIYLGEQDRGLRRMKQGDPDMRGYIFLWTPMNDNDPLDQQVMIWLLIKLANSVSPATGDEEQSEGDDLGLHALLSIKYLIKIVLRLVKKRKVKAGARFRLAAAMFRLKGSARELGFSWFDRRRMRKIRRRILMRMPYLWENGKLKHMAPVEAEAE